MKTAPDIGLNKYYHTPAATAWISLRNMNLVAKALDMQQYDNGATMSDTDRIKSEKAARERILSYVNGMVGKAQLVSAAEIAGALGLSEAFVICTLELFEMQLEDGGDIE